MLNEKIRELRIASGISQVELAKRLGVTKQSVSNWENDNIQPSIDMLIKISKELNVSCDCLLGLDKRRYIEVTGLNDIQISHIQQIIQDISNNN